MSRFFEPSFWLETTPEEVKKELKSSMDVHARDSFDNTVLIFASYYCNYPEVIQMLIDAGADINAKNKKGIVPLTIACDKNKNFDVVVTLLDNGAKLS